MLAVSGVATDQELEVFRPAFSSRPINSIRTLNDSSSASAPFDLLLVSRSALHMFRKLAIVRWLTSSKLRFGMSLSQTFENKR